MIPKVLVADDHPGLRKLVRLVLDTGQFEIVEAADGEAALEQIETITPDLVILDLMLPRLDGFALLEHLRENPATQAVPAVVLTGKDLSDEERRLLNERAVSLLRKSGYSPEALGRVIREALAR